MAILNNDTTLNAEILLEKQNGTKITLSTNEKYVEKDIELTINAPTANPTYVGGNISGSIDILDNNIETSTLTNNSGITIEALATIVSNSINYENDLNGWITKSIDEIAMGGKEATIAATPLYLNGVYLEANKSFNIHTSGTIVGLAIVGNAIAGDYSTTELTTNSSGTLVFSGFTNADEVSY